MGNLMFENYTSKVMKKNMHRILFCKHLVFLRILLALSDAFGVNTVCQVQ